MTGIYIIFAFVVTVNSDDAMYERTEKLELLVELQQKALNAMQSQCSEVKLEVRRLSKRIFLIKHRLNGDNSKVFLSVGETHKDIEKDVQQNLERTVLVTANTTQQNEHFINSMGSEYILTQHKDRPIEEADESTQRDDNQQTLNDQNRLKLLDSKKGDTKAESRF